MAIQIQGDGGVVADVGGTNFRAQKTQACPTDHGSLGHYRISVVTGTMAAALAASAQVFQFKWTDATRLAVIYRLRARFLPLTPFTAGTLTDYTSLAAYFARPFAAGGGGNALNLTGDNMKLRTNMGTSLAAINISTTAALTAATGLDAHSFAQSVRKGNRVNPAAATEETIQPSSNELEFHASVDAGEHPIVLAQNEGIIIRNRTVWPAAGTGIILVECSWAEVAAY